jgi:hypothetical protein
LSKITNRASLQHRFYSWFDWKSRQSMDCTRRERTLAKKVLGRRYSQC